VRAKTSRGRGIRCQSCGGTFPLATLAAAVSCRYCGARQELAGQTFAEARQYEADVFSEMQKADAERRQAAGWSQWSGRGGNAAKLVVGLIGAMMVVPTCLSLPAYLLHMGHVQIPVHLEAVVSVLGSSRTRSSSQRAASRRRPPAVRHPEQRRCRVISR